jgi:hypothetical protein
VYEVLTKGSALFHIERPVLLHVRNNSGAVCTCGCNSREARVKKTIPHINMLLEKHTGARVFRAPDNAAWFDEMVAKPEVERIYMPHRTTDSQWHIVKDFRQQMRRGQMRKVCVAFGGNRSGKTTSMIELEADVWCLKGGPGVNLINVAPTLEKNTITLKKLVLGDSSDRRIESVIDPRLVLHYPKNGEILRDGQSVTFVDGTKIVFRHGNASGGNQKGVVGASVFVDELCEIRKYENYLVLINRTMDTGGCVFGSTTPVQGHWAKEEVYNCGRQITEAGPDDEVVWTHLSCHDNPFMNKAKLQKVINSIKDDRLRRREIEGEWVPEGLVLWENYDARDMEHGGNTFAGNWRPEAHGFTNITDRALGLAFRRCKAETRDHFGGVDFNVKPMSLAVMQIVVPDGANEDNPANWCLWVPHEVVLDGGVLKFADHLEKGAAKDLGLPDDYFDSMALACDSTGAQRGNEGARIHGVSNVSSSLVDFLKVRGHDARPCNLSDHGNPANPDQIKTINLVNKLFRDGRIFVHRERCKRIIHALETQEQTSDGKIDKEPGKFTDKLSGPTDALRYGAWMLLARHEPEFSRKIRYAA